MKSAAEGTINEKREGARKMLQLVDSIKITLQRMCGRPAKMKWQTADCRVHGVCVTHNGYRSSVSFESNNLILVIPRMHTQLLRGNYSESKFCGQFFYFTNVQRFRFGRAIRTFFIKIFYRV